MKRILESTVLCLAVLTLCFAGCKKTQPKPTTPMPTPPEMQMPQAAAPDAVPPVEEVKKAVEPVAQEVKKEAEKAAEGVDMSATIDNLKSQVAGMDVASLQSVAEKYKTEILAKQDLLKAGMEKMGVMSFADKLSTEGKALTGEINQLTDDLSNLKARFDVYLNAIKDKGGDISALSI